MHPCLSLHVKPRPVTQPAPYAAQVRHCTSPTLHKSDTARHCPTLPDTARHCPTPADPDVATVVLLTLPTLSRRIAPTTKPGDEPGFVAIAFLQNQRAYGGQLTPPNSAGSTFTITTPFAVAPTRIN
jgi:hypothetical protein